jgi:hypothetical protein
MNYNISRENYDFLTKMVALAETRLPVQGDFCFDTYQTNHNIKEKEGVANCGTTGCLLGGFAPLIDNERFYFHRNGIFVGFIDFKWQLTAPLFYALFICDSQKEFHDSLIDLMPDSTQLQVVENAKKVLALLTIID